MEILAADEQNVLRGLLFQDPSMHQSYNAYPEFLCINATYKLLEIRLPVYILLCEDGSGMICIYIFKYTDIDFNMLACIYINV